MSESRQTPDLPHRPPARILVVDDDRAVRRSTQYLLSDLGYRVFEASGGVEAVSVLRMPAAHIELVLVDVVMPGMDGVSLLKVIRAEWPHVRVMLMSAYPAQVMVEHGLTEIGVPFLAKPFTRAELAAKVADELARPLSASPRLRSGDGEGHAGSREGRG